MRKQVLFWAGIVILSVMFMLNSAYAAEKLGYVDLSRIFSEYGKTKDYDKVLSDKQASYEKEREKKVNEIKQFQDKMNLLSDKEKEAKKSDIEIKVKALQEFDRQKQTDLRKEQDDKMKEILKDIEEAVKGYAEKEGYTMIFNDRVLVYQVKDADVTSQVLGILGKSYKG